MSLTPWNGGVLAAAAVVASPALWLSLVEGTLPLGDALTRYLLSVVMCWAALNVVAQLVMPGGERAPGLDGAGEGVPAEQLAHAEHPEPVEG